MTVAVATTSEILRRLKKACSGLPSNEDIVQQLQQEVELGIFSGMTEEQFSEALIHTAVQNIQIDPVYDIIATRLTLEHFYQQIIATQTDDPDFLQKYQDGFVAYIEHSVGERVLDQRMYEMFDLPALASSLVPAHDQLLNYMGVMTIVNRYAVRTREQELAELPQYFWMRAAMGLSLCESDSTQRAMFFYKKLSQLDFLSAGSTNVNVGAFLPQLTNCCLLEMQDDLHHIGKTVADLMILMKATAGIGLGMTKLRAAGAPVRSNNSVSTGPIPFMNVVDATLRAVARRGKKGSALAFYLENWHLDFADFLDLKDGAGDHYRRAHSANTAVWISDEFMKRVIDDEDWYLFDPFDAPDLTELVGQAFSNRYNEYIRMAEAREMRVFKKMKAREQYRAMLISLLTSGNPWLTWKDSVNLRALNNNTGVIHNSNLCTEITLPQDEKNIANCNLASVNLSRHLENGEWQWKRLEESTRTAIRFLDNLIDITVSTVPESDYSNQQNRAIGVGIMGFSEVLERLGYPYESEEAYDLADQLLEFISYHAIDESANLAQERGSYLNFSGSRWSEGWVPFDTIDAAEQERGIPITVSRKTRLNWDTLRAKVRQGMRNSTVMAIAPTANIAFIAGTSPGIDPRFANIFSRATDKGKFIEVNQNLVRTLKEEGLWEEVREDIVRYQGDISRIVSIPERIRKVYKTSFDIAPSAYIEVAARAQKWVDQAMSRNMYFSDRDIDTVMHVYIDAWRKGLKTTYYAHVKQRHTSEQVTTRVNKSEAITGTKSFGFGRQAKVAKPEQVPITDAEGVEEKMEASTPSEAATCPVDPMDRLQCEACQ